MKNDLSFKFLSAVIIAGVIVALVNPGPAVTPAKTGLTLTQMVARP